MAGENETNVRITATSEVAAGVEQAKGSIQGLDGFVGELKASFATLGGQIDELKAQFASFGATSQAAMHQTRAATAEVSGGLGGMIMRVHEGAEELRTMQARAREFAEIYASIFLVHELKEWISSMAEAAEKTEHLSQRLGMTTSQVQALRGVTLGTGISMDTLAKGLQMLDNRAVTSAGAMNSAAQAFKAMGISANDGSSNMERLLIVADKFKDIPDGPTKAALAMQLFGRSGAELIPILNLGRDTLQAYMAKMQEYGGVSEEAQAKGEELARSVNESKIAWEGFKTSLMAGFAPLLRDMTDNFNGLAKSTAESGKQASFAQTTMQGLSDFLENVGHGVKVLAETITWFAHECYQGFLQVKVAALEWWMTMVTSFDKVVGALNITGAEFKAFAAVAYDALHFHWSSIAADWQAGMEEVRATVRREGQAIINDARNIATQVKQTFAEITQNDQSYSKWADAFLNPPRSKGLPSPHGGGGGPAPDITPKHKEKKEKQPKDDLVQRLEDELTARKMVWDEEQDAQDTAQQFSLESEKAYWANVLETVTMSAKDRGEVERKYLEVSKQLREQQISQQIATYKDDEAEAGRNADAKLQIVKQEVAFIGRMRGEQSTQYKDALRREVEAERAAAEQKRQIAQELADEMRKLQDLRIAQEEADARFLVEMGRKTQGQLIADERNFENQRYAAAVADAQRRKAIIDPNRDPVAYAKANAEIETIERQHQNTLTQIDQKAVLQRTAIERQAVNQLSSSWGQALGQMVTLQAGFASTIKSLWQGLQQAIGNAVGSIIQNWLTQHLSALLVAKAASKVAALSDITTSAGKAGAAGIASYAGAPWPIDMGAPAFGAAMAANAMGYASFISAEGGAWTVPGGPAILHPDEMVLPAWAASPLRDMISGRRPANANTPAAANDRGRGAGDAHLHLHGDIIHNPAQLEAWFKKNAPAVGAGVRQYVRNGGSTSR